MKARFVLPALLMVGLLVAAGASNAEAGLFGSSHGCGCAPEPTCCAPESTCCAPEISCCAPRHGLLHKLRHHLANRCKPACCAPEPTCCAPEPTCCAPEPTCCAPEPTCCAPEPSCCGPRHRHGLLHKLRHHLRSCCQPTCCEVVTTCCG